MFNFSLNSTLTKVVVTVLWFLRAFESLYKTITITN